MTKIMNIFLSAVNSYCRGDKNEKINNFCNGTYYVNTYNKWCICYT